MYHLTAFPDSDYFLWQTQVQHYNFIKHGVDLNTVICLVSYNNKINPKFLEYSKKINATILFYEDEIPHRNYIPSIRPNLIKRFFRDNPHFEKEYVLFHDSDVIYQKLPNFEGMKDNRWHLADTISYIGYQYLKTTREDILPTMANVVGLNIETIINNNHKSGGGQYFGKGSTYELWNKIENDTANIYNKLIEIDIFQKKELKETGKTNSENIIQSWTAGMWAELYNLWFFNHNTVVDEELNFSWGTDNVENYFNRNIFHNAGVTEQLKDNYFFKGAYITNSPFNEKFNITPDKACFYYVKEIENTKQWLLKLYGNNLF